jgi:hypothetical protein
VTLLAAKLLLSPICVIAVSLVGRRWGVAVAGLLGGLPVVAGPILLVETLVHGRDFGGDAAAGTLLGLVALTAFVVVYGRVAGLGPIRGVLCGWCAFLVGVALLSLVRPPLAIAALLAASSFWVGLRLLPPATSPLPQAVVRPWWDLPLRAVAALALVVLLTAVSGALGPHLSGLIAPFPVITSVLAIFIHAHEGIDAARVLLRNFLVGFYGFAAFCLTLALTLPELTAAAAFGLAIVAALAVQVVVWAARSGGISRRARGYAR